MMKRLSSYVLAVSMFVSWGCGSMPPSSDSVPDVQGDQAETQPLPGGNDVGDTSLPPSDDSEPVSDADEVEDVDTSMPPETATCPSLQETFELMIPASYAVVIEYRTGPGSEDATNFTLGTAFAVGARILATNAHVAAGVLENVLPVDRVVAVQAGTGKVFELTGATKHPGYNGDPLGSPDVAIMTAQDELPVFLELAPTEDVADLAAGDELALTGFPGDVQELFEITPGTTVPQATALSGSITALRSFEPTAIVSADNIDFIQHQLATTPGTSGSPLVRCGKVVAVHNAGTVKVVLAFDAEGQLTAERQSAASNNFGIHVKHLQDLLTRVEDDLLTAESLPPADPSFAGSYACAAISVVTDLVSHVFELTVDEDRSISGASTWPNAVLILTGNVDRFGEVQLSDNGASQGFVPVFYAGFASVQTDAIGGLYFDGESSLGVWGCSRN